MSLLDIQSDKKKMDNVCLIYCDDSYYLWSTTNIDRSFAYRSGYLLASVSTNRLTAKLTGKSKEIFKILELKHDEI